MIARPKISRNERNTAERGAFEVGNFAPFSRPGPPGSRGPRASRVCASTSTRPSTRTAPTSPRRSSPRRGPSSSSTSTSTDRRASAPRRVRRRRREWRRGLDRTSSRSLEPRRRNRSCESIVYAAGGRTPGRERARRDASARAGTRTRAPAGITPLLGSDGASTKWEVEKKGLPHGVAATAALLDKTLTVLAKIPFAGTLVPSVSLPVDLSSKPKFSLKQSFSL